MLQQTLLHGTFVCPAVSVPTLTFVAALVADITCITLLLLFLHVTNTHALLNATQVVSVPTLLFDAAALAVSTTLFFYTARPAKRAHFLPAVNAPLTACTSYCCDIAVNTILAALYGMSVVFNVAFLHNTQGIGLSLALDASMMVLFLATAALSSRMGAVILSTDDMAVPLVELQEDACVAPGDWQVL